MLSEKSDAGLSRLTIDHFNIVEHVDYPWKYDEQNPKELLEAFQRFRILTPLRKGPYGVETLNRTLVRHYLSKTDQWFVAPIMLVNNDYRLELWNGEVGILVRRKSEHIQEGDFAIFPKRGKVPALLLPKYEYAYCLSVHKSQGSEFDHVLLLMPEGSEVFGRELLYTAATRARKKLEVWGSDEVLEKTINTQSHRLSGISHRFKQNLI